MLKQPTILTPSVPATLPEHDLHNHTIYSGHSGNDATVPNLVRRANELNLRFLGISEHLMDASDLESLEPLMQDVNLCNSPDTTILFGVEMDIDPSDPQGRQVAPGFPCDYVILSAHGFPQFDLRISPNERLLPAWQQHRNLARKWIDWYACAIQTGGFHILGHPLREPISIGLISLADDELFDACIELFRPAIPQQIAFELNNSFLAYLQSTTQYAPYLNLLQELKRLGMKFSRGSDSHSVASVGACDAIQSAADLLQLSIADWLDPSGFGMTAPG